MSDGRDWIEEGKKHLIQTKMHPERLCLNYPTRDKHSAKDEADFIHGFRTAEAEWNSNGSVRGLEAYVQELSEERDAPQS